MGVYGALLTGVTGLQGQSTKMGAISDNIANVNTVGYKKADVPFQSLVTDPFGRATTYSPGGVLAKPRQLISQQGVISGTASATDFAISGRGFFVVSEETDASIDNSRFYTRAGSFRAAIDPDDATAALLQNTGGFYLTGIPVTDRDNLPEPSSLTQVETVNINRISNSARATESAELQANLPSELTQSGATISVFDADGTQTDLSALTGTNVTTGDVVITKADGTQVSLSAANFYAGAPAGTPPATVTLQEFVDGLNGYNETLRITANATDVVAAGATPVISLQDNGDQIEQADLTAMLASVAAPNEVTDLVTAINGFTGSSSGVAGEYDTDNGDIVSLEASLVGSQLVIRATQTTGGVTSQVALDPSSLTSNDFTIAGAAPVVEDDSNIDITADIDANGFLSIAAFENGQQIDIDVSANDIVSVTTSVTGSNGDFAETFQGDLTLTQQVFDALGTEHSVSFDWRKRDDESNLWEVNLSDNGVTDFSGTYDPSGGNNGARFVVEDTGGNLVETQRLFMKFNGDGSLAEVRTTLDGAAGVAFGQRTSTGTTGVVANRETETNEDPKLISVAIGQATIATNGEAIATPVADVGQGDNFTDNGAEAIVFEWNVGRPTDLTGADAGTGLDGLTQFDSGEASPTIEQFFYAQDGARFGNLAGVQIDESGTLSALFDNGVVEPIYVIPIATFNNPNGLINATGNIFAESPDSGQVQVKRAGENGAGDIIGSAVENSNVDLGDEFTDMIITQQSFTANTRTITTSDRMLEELVRILR